MLNSKVIQNRLRVAMFVFFFQAEDGIRDLTVTGVQTCALPIWARISAARRVASPGCYATAAIVALAPLLAAGLAEPRDIVIVAASGTSGAGRSVSAAPLATEVMGAVSAYQVGGTHRHTPEIEQALAGVTSGQGARQANAEIVQPTVSFTPMLAPMPRGILATCTIRPASGEASTPAVRAALGDSYAGEPFGHPLPGGPWPTTAAAVGSHDRHLQAGVGVPARRCVLV